MVAKDLSNRVRHGVVGCKVRRKETTNRSVRTASMARANAVAASLIGRGADYRTTAALSNHNVLVAKLRIVSLPDRDAECAHIHMHDLAHGRRLDASACLYERRWVLR